VCNNPTGNQSSERNEEQAKQSNERKSDRKTKPVHNPKKNVCLTLLWTTATGTHKCGIELIFVEMDISAIRFKSEFSGAELPLIKSVIVLQLVLFIKPTSLALCTFQKCQWLPSKNQATMSLHCPHKNLLHCQMKINCPTASK
jgi:hypothetical protein